MALKDIAGVTNPRQATLEDMIKLIRTAMGMEAGHNAVKKDAFANTQFEEMH